jgi:hypothetical protein
LKGSYVIKKVPPELKRRKYKIRREIFAAGPGDSIEVFAKIFALSQGRQPTVMRRL